MNIIIIINTFIAPFQLPAQGAVQLQYTHNSLKNVNFKYKVKYK